MTPPTTPKCLLIFASADKDPYPATVTPEILSQLLENAGVQVSTVTEATDVTTERLAEADLMVLWTLFGEGCEAAYDRVYAQVELGTPLLCLHTAIWSATSVNKAAPIGGPFAGHPPYQDLMVKVDESVKHPIVERVTDFSVTDEAYQIDFENEVTVLAYTGNTGLKLWEDVEGKPHRVTCNQWTQSHAKIPLVYAKRLGKGSVVNNVLGHNATVLAHPSFIKITHQAVQWLLGTKNA